MADGRNNLSVSEGASYEFDLGDELRGRRLLPGVIDHDGVSGPADEARGGRSDAATGACDDHRCIHGLPSQLLPCW